MGVVYHHGWRDRATATAWLENRGLRLGDGLFETVRVVSGRALFVAEHAARLHRGLAALGLDVPPELTPAGFAQLVNELIAQNELAAGAKVRLTLWRVGGEGSYRPSGRRADFLIEANAILINAYSVARDQRLVVSESVRLTPWGLSGHKTLSALPYVQAAREAEQRGADDAVILSADGQVVEAGRANLFVVSGESLVTPPLASGCLDGVLRRVLLQACAQRKLTVVEAPVSLEALLSAEAAFTTNVVAGIFPVRHLDAPDGRHKSYDAQHPLIEAAYRALQARVSGAQSGLF